MKEATKSISMPMYYIAAKPGYYSDFYIVDDFGNLISVPKLAFLFVWDLEHYE